MNKNIKLWITMLFTACPLVLGSVAFCSEIQDAINSGDLEKVKALLKANPDLASNKDDDGDTLLHEAAYRDNKDLAVLLLANKADVNSKDKNGTTPLHLAAFRGNTDIVEVLLENKADVNATNRNSQTPLDEIALPISPSSSGIITIPPASEYPAASLAIADLLITNGADVNVHLLLSVLLRHNWALAKLLIEKSKVDVNAKGMGGQTALHYAADGGSEEVARILLKRGADINAKANDGWTPLLDAVDKQHKDVIELLLANNADLNAKDNNGDTALHIAVATGQKDVAELLRKHGGHE